MQSINKSLARLDHISNLNWSKRDLNLEAVSNINQVFRKVVTTVDPNAFSLPSKEVATLIMKDVSSNQNKA